MLAPPVGSLPGLWACRLPAQAHHRASDQGTYRPAWWSDRRPEVARSTSRSLAGSRAGGSSVAVLPLRFLIISYLSH